MQRAQFLLGKVCLIVVDPQQKLMVKIHRAKELTAQCLMMIRCFRELGLPVLACTQYLQGLGGYTPELEEAVVGLQRYDKMTFSALGDKEVIAAIAALPQEVESFALIGMETHICVFQSAVDLLAMGKNVWVVSDAVSARKPEQHEAAIAQLRAEGAVVAPAESLLYTMLDRAGTPEFKKVLPHVIAQAG